MISPDLVFKTIVEIRLDRERGQALASLACRRRQKEYECPQITSVAAAH
jgi:hypothetical protein